MTPPDSPTPPATRLTDEETVRLNTWLHDLEEHQLREDDRQALEALLLASEPARRYLVQRLGMGAALCRLADEAQEAEGTPPLTASPRRSWPVSAKLALAASLTMLGALAALLLLSPPEPNAESSEVVAGGISDEGCAVLVDAVGAEWADGLPRRQVGMAVPAGLLQLRKGIARLEFYSGASVTLEGRSELEIVSVNEARCRFGQMRVHVPPHARGFKLITPDAEVVDLGTEFGLRVSDAGKADVHVFDGEVEVHPEAGGDKLNLKTGGRWNAASGAGLDGADPSSFADIASLHAQSQNADERRLLAWRVGLQKFLDDPRLLVGYTFEPQNAWDRSLRNQRPAAEEFTHGSVVGAQWTQGRWRGKKALDFKSPGDRVRLAVSGEHQAITLATWVQVGGMDRNFNSLFLTDTWAKGNPHWQYVRNGSFALGIHSFGGGGQHVFYSPVIFGPENLGVWFHLATTFDLRTGVGRHYVNGKIVSEYQSRDIAPETRIRIGSGELGNWGLPEGNKPRNDIRSFNGRMDEFLLFSEALSPEEVTRLYEVGRPN